MALRQAIKGVPPELSAIERAFELARSGRFAIVQDLEKALFSEGYEKSANPLIGNSLRKQLREECRKAFASAPPKGH